MRTCPNLRSVIGGFSLLVYITQRLSVLLILYPLVGLRVLDLHLVQIKGNWNIESFLISHLMPIKKGHISSTPKQQTKFQNVEHFWYCNYPPNFPKVQLRKEYPKEETYLKIPIITFEVHIFNTCNISFIT